MTATQLVITADDFGADEAINEAVSLAHAHGTLSCASIMMGQVATHDAVARAKAMPALGVGLHLTLVWGAAVLPQAEVDALLGDDGSLMRDLPKAGMRWAFHPRARAQLKREIAAQFQAFADTGLSLDHVNAHNHMHLHPLVLREVIRHARALGCRWVRLPHEPGGLPWIARPWLSMMRARLNRAGLRCNDRVIGLKASGHYHADAMVSAVRSLPSGINELYLHPATRSNAHVTGQLPGYDPVGEFEALMSEDLFDALQERKLKPVRFADLV